MSTITRRSVLASGLLTLGGCVTAGGFAAPAPKPDEAVVMAGFTAGALLPKIQLIRVDPDTLGPAGGTYGAARVTLSSRALLGGRRVYDWETTQPGTYVIRSISLSGLGFRPSGIIGINRYGHVAYSVTYDDLAENPSLRSVNYRVDLDPGKVNYIGKLVVDASGRRGSYEPRMVDVRSRFDWARRYYKDKTGSDAEVVENLMVSTRLETS